MRSIAVLLVGSCFVLSLLTRPSLASPDEKAIHRAMEQQRRAAESEMRRQAEYEKKVMEQQKRAMQEQMKAQQRFMGMQQKAMMEQQKAMLHQQQNALHQQQNALHQQQNASKSMQHASTPHVTTTATATPIYHAHRPYYGHHSYGHAYHRTSYHHYRQMPNQVDPRARALQRLKRSLDSVQMGRAVTPGEKTAIKRALMGVVMVPKVPSVATINQLAGHLTNGLANRGAANAQTGPMALTLRGVLNSSEMANADLTEIMTEHRSALKNSRVRPTEIIPIMESLKTISNQERLHR